MPLFGAHMSIAGGYYKSLVAAQDHDCQAVQLFTKNNNQWAGKALTDEDIRLFRVSWQDSKLHVSLSHDSYLINLASPDETLWRRSLEAFVVEMERAEALGLNYLVMHPGAAVDGDEKAGLVRVARSLDEVHGRCPKYQVKILLETTAGQGTCLGHRFEHLAEIMHLSKNPERLGVCLDTCHVFAAGYSLAPLKEYRKTMKEFDKVVGLDRLLAFHLNDSKKPLGSRVDRHEHIGQGCLGIEPFRFLVNDKRFRKHAMILETPKENDMDRVNLKTLRDL
jgi:deoxyribonuclease IV